MCSRSLFHLLTAFLLLTQCALAADVENVGIFSSTQTWLSEQWRKFQNDLANDNYQPSFNAQRDENNKQYIVGIHPLHNPKRLFEIYGPIIDYINNRMPEIHLKLEASRNYDEFDKKLYERHFDFAMPNPYQTIRALKRGYKVFGKMADDEAFRGLILIRKDSGIQNVTDLKGKAIAYPGASALAATMMPQYYLHTHGLDINHDVDNRYVGSQESSIMNVLLGHVAAACTWPIPWKAFVAEHPDQAAELEVKWQTEPLINNSWMVRDDVPSELGARFADALFGLQNHTSGLKLLESVPISRFEAANELTYAPVSRFLQEFNATVRSIEQ